ncbi:DUF1192 domain-containing protein [Pararhizobium sp. IMCC21322]|uniref:DUF1192 domain-containing protein n=1 Tax=Pararhizobium sp. IMCC21322 TaxID=3067903 RepID=UPI00274231AB|nr:DUF1192 domain-containing protein [Pararhizobium sp. IMCC21322]
MTFENSAFYIVVQCQSDTGLVKQENDVPRYDEEGRKIETSAHAIGADLSDLSVEELQEGILMLREEISRMEAAIEGKSGSIAAAEAFFKS